MICLQGDNDAAVCVVKDKYCYENLANNMFAENHPRFKLCDCLPDCNSIDYDFEFVSDRKLGHHDFDSYFDRKLEDHGMDHNGTSDGPVVVSSKIVINFGSDEYFAYKRFESYGTVEMVSNVGGLLGLFLGISIFSLIEIVYFFTIRLVNSFETIKPL